MQPESLSWSGSNFQTVGPATENARRPNVLRRCLCSVDIYKCICFVFVECLPNSIHQMFFLSSVLLLSFMYVILWWSYDDVLLYSVFKPNSTHGCVAFLEDFLPDLTQKMFLISDMKDIAGTFNSICVTYTNFQQNYLKYSTKSAPV